jgi:hypothetical protein
MEIFLILAAVGALIVMPRAVIGLVSLAAVGAFWLLVIGVLAAVVLIAAALIGG